jgi:hypothetical protein
MAYSFDYQGRPQTVLLKMRRIPLKLARDQVSYSICFDVLRAPNNSLSYFIRVVSVRFVEVDSPAVKSEMADLIDLYGILGHSMRAADGMSTVAH